MAIKAPPMTPQEFEEFATRQENFERRLELIGGEVVELVSNPNSTRIALRIARLIGSYLDKHPYGYMTVEEGGYRIGDDRYMPDVAYLSKPRQSIPSEWFNSLAPNLAVINVSPSDEMVQVVDKVMNLWTVGVVVWAVYLKSKEIQIFVPGQPSKKLSVDDTLAGGSVLPGFTVKLRDIFKDE